jgi:type IV fimbrial biogenesis protein FimT
MKSLFKNSGYTLMELSITLAVIAILAALALPNMLGPRADAKLKGAMNNLKGDLNIARMTAVKTSVAVVVQFYSDHYEIYSDSDLDWLPAGERTIRNRVLPAGVSINLGTTDFENDRTRFNTRGLPDNLGSVGLGSVVLSNSNGDQRTLQLNRVGRILVN